MKNLLTVIAVIFISFNSFAADEWKIKENGVSISIEDKKFKGSFDNLSGIIKFSPNDLDSSSFDVAINTPEVKVDGSGLQDKHLRSDNWLNVDEYKEITFKSYQIIKTKKGFEVKGDLTIVGITQDATIPFTFTETKEGGIFEGKFVVKRKEFEMGPNGNTVETVEVTIKVEVTQ